MRTCTADGTHGASVLQKGGDHPFREMGGRGSGAGAGSRGDEGLWPQILAEQKEVSRA